MPTVLRVLPVLPARPGGLRRLLGGDPPAWAFALARVLVLALALGVLPSVFTADVTHYWRVGRAVGPHHLPYRGFLWEFPPLTTAVLLLVPLGGGHRAVFAALFVTVAVACEVATHRRVRALAPPDQRAAASWCWLLVVVPLSSIAWFRLDWPSALAAVVALEGVLRGSGRRAVGGVLAGAGVKLWPLVLVVPLVALRRTRQAAAAVVLAGLAVLAWHLFSPSGLAAFLRFRAGTGFQVESVPGALVLLLGHHRARFRFGAHVVSDAGWAWVGTALLGVLVVGAGLAAVLLRRRRVDVVALSGALVLLVVLTSRLVSPQYLVWVAPFVALRAARSRVVAGAFAAAVWATLVEIDHYGLLVSGAPALAALVVLRNAALLVVLAGLCRLALDPPRDHHRAPLTGGAPGGHDTARGPAPDRGPRGARRSAGP